VLGLGDVSGMIVEPDAPQQMLKAFEQLGVLTIKG
jgi:hypothetical protein